MDLLLKNGLVVTMNDGRRIFRGNIGIEAGRIAYVGKKLPRCCETVDASGKLVLPGFVNAHCHGLHILWRGGRYERLSLYPWLFRRLFPLQEKVSASQARKGIRLFIKNCLFSGVTTILDSTDAGRRTGIVEASLAEYRQSPLRVLYGRSFFDSIPSKEFFTERGLGKEDRDSFEGCIEDTDRAIIQTSKLMKKHNTSPSNVSVYPFPAEPNFVSLEGLRRSLALAKEFDTVVSTHCSEVLQDSKINGIPAIRYLDEAGFLSSRTTLAHCTHLTTGEISFLAKRRVKVAHNFITNLFLRDGIAPVPEMLRAGIIVGLGTDDANANSSVGFLSDLKALVLVHGLRSAAITPQKALEMITIDAASAIGLEKEVGSIEIGKRADLVLLDATAPNMRPIKDVYSTVVFQASEYNIQTIANGTIIAQASR